jgi:uncharacterized protein (TIGR02757 family)
MTKSEVDHSALKEFLEEKHDKYNRLEFIEDDPISIPHLFTLPQDVEISGFFAAILAWGQRKTIIKKCQLLLNMMDNSPYDFIMHHQENDLIPFLNFKHRTFNDIDTLYFIEFFKWFYQSHDSLEDAFFIKGRDQEVIMEHVLVGFQKIFFSLPDFPKRTKKHVSSPVTKSACKRINMFLRWMVRKDHHNVDFGIWKKIKPSQLIMPCDVHVDRIARRLGLITRKPTDWLTAVELTNNLKAFDNQDPVKYDFALFGLGIEEKWGSW